MYQLPQATSSLSARRAWIEINWFLRGNNLLHVALRKESVDRNYCWRPRHSRYCRSLSARRAWIEIALTDPRCGWTGSLSARRAWIEIALTDHSCGWTGSLSARRAWIEIFIRREISLMRPVALRKESVDRNASAHMLCCTAQRSLSARRAWIEIDRGVFVDVVAEQSLSARRAWIEIVLFGLSHMMQLISRSPQGERG